MGSGGVAIAALPTVIYLEVPFSDGLGGADRGLHFCKETNKICKNALFLDFLAYLHFVAW